MKYLSLTYSRSFPWSPVSDWVGRPRQVAANDDMQVGAGSKTRRIPNPFYTSRALWLSLGVHLDGVTLNFADPVELDHVRAVFGEKVLQNARIPGADMTVGRPNSHWLSRLPSKAKSPKYRAAFERLVSRDSAEMRTFRAFYAQKGAA